MVRRHFGSGHTAPGALRACLLLLALLGTTSVAASCTSMASTAGSPNGAPASATTGGTTGAMPGAMTGAMAAAWAGRPDYTSVSPRTEEAYRYAMQHHDTLRFLPCYCGCGAMGHGSNLDCYYEPRGDGAISFEEHASYCDICVDITLRAKELAASGTPLATIRTIVDLEFGNTGPGTDTAFPTS